MTPPAVEVEALSKAFEGLHAVQGVSLRVEEGERRILIGPNGAGKTTLFNCIAGSLRATSGRVSVFGRDVTQLAEHRRAALGMARTFQISNVFTELTLLDNVVLAILGTDRRKWTLFRPAASYGAVRDRAHRALAEVGLEDRAGLRVQHVSYGERRQLELAIALGADRRLILLDEPCAGLSPGERQDISRIIAGLPRSVTVLMIEHDMDVALGLADRVSVLHRGAIIVEGTPAEVQASPEVHEVYFGHG